MRAKVRVEEKGQRPVLVVTEIPYQVNKASLIAQIAALVKAKKIEDIVGLRDESDRQGLRIAIELKRGANPQVVLNQLYKHTALQTSFTVNLLAIVDGEPKVLSLLDLMRHYLDHRKEVVRRRSLFELRKAEERAHVLEGLLIALDHIDEVIALIRGSEDAPRPASPSWNASASPRPRPRPSWTCASSASWPWNGRSFWRSTGGSWRRSPA